MSIQYYGVNYILPGNKTSDIRKTYSLYESYFKTNILSPFSTKSDKFKEFDSYGAENVTFDLSKIFFIITR